MHMSVEVNPTEHNGLTSKQILYYNLDLKQLPHEFMFLCNFSVMGYFMDYVLKHKKWGKRCEVLKDKRQ